MQYSAEILMIDDDAEITDFVPIKLRRKGYSILTASSIPQASECLKNHHPDLILLAVQIGGMSGIEFCKRLKRNAETSDIAVIFLTAENAPTVIKQGFGAGGCDYILKPFTNEELLARIKTHIEISKNTHKLEAVNQELRNFCSVISHDLKASLHVLNLLVAELGTELRENDTENIDEIMKMIQTKSTKLAVMVERLLEFSKMCNITPALEDVTISELAQHVFHEMRMLYPERNIELRIKGTIPEVRGDAVLLEMLLKNILSNAIKFTKHKENAIIEMSAESTAMLTIIKIKDNGAGFDMQYSDKLFHIFQRLHSDDEFEGTGVGLALCDKIMQYHEGKIAAHGEVGKGAEITLYFNHAGI